MTYKQIEAARETRLWLGQIITPIVTTIGTLMLVPEVRESTKQTAEDIKWKLKEKLRKK